MEIKRENYLQQLLIRECNGQIKIVTGVRRSGKSYLLFKIFKRTLLERGIPENHIIEAALDALEFDELRDPHSLLAFVKSKLLDNAQYYVLLDEIQFVTRFHEVLNSLLRLDNVDVYVTGSNSRFLSSDVITEFRGRGDEVRVRPLSFAEYRPAFNGSEEDAWNDYMTFGGLPRVLAIQGDAQKSQYLQDLFQETYMKDIVERYNIRDAGDLDDLVNVLASAIGSLTNPTRLQNTFKSEKKSNISDKTIKNYLDYLTDAFLIDKALRWDIKGKRYINTPLKYYFVDPGLRNARLGFRQIEENHLMENIIFNELKGRGYAVDVGLVEVRSPERGGRQRLPLEVDFIAYRGNNKYYIQSAFLLPDAEKEAQEARPLTHISDSFKKIIVVGNHIKLKRNEAGITTMGVREFLLNPNSLDL